MFPSLLVLSLLGALFFCARRKMPTFKLRDLRGPELSSFWLGAASIIQGWYLSFINVLAGHQPEYVYQKETGESEFKWIREYGSAWQVRGCMGVGFKFPSVFYHD
jgi:hypothetical protein